MLNPELKRHIWLKGSLFHLLIVPLIAVLILFLLMLNHDTDTTRTETALVYASFIILMGYGVYLASQSLLNDFKDQTWDQQRMSAMSAWSLTWGKLLGSTLTAWYLVAVIWVAYCLIYSVRYGSLSLSSFEIIPSFVCMALAMQALSLTFTLYLNKTKGKAGLSMIPMILLVAVIYSLIAGVPGLSHIRSQIFWWHFEIPVTIFLFYSSVLVLVVSLIFAWRTMRIRLLMRDYPWAWVGFILILNFYLLGLMSNMPKRVFVPDHIIRINLFLLVTTPIFYFLLFTESFSFAQAHRLVLRLKSGQWSLVFKGIPLFVVTYFMIMLLFIYACFQVNPAFILSILLLMLRDAFIVMAFYFSKRFKGPMMGLLSIVVINMILPYVLEAFSLYSVAEYLNPFIDSGFLKYSSMLLHTAPSSYKELVILSIHCILAGGFMWMNWKSRMALLPS